MNLDKKNEKKMSKKRILLIFILKVISIYSLPTNCKEGNDSSCTKCNDNFVLLNDKCPCYDRNCNSCNSSRFGDCTECKENFVLDSSTNTCRLNIPNCIYFNDNGCDTCEPGYNLKDGMCVKDDNYSPKCHENCKKCYSENEGECKICKSGYQLDKGNCIKNPGCSLIMYSDCLICPTGYFGFEMTCNTDCFGAKCNEDGTCDNNCLTCRKGFLFEELGCKPNNFCGEKCEMCRSKDLGCDRCEIGYRVKSGNCEKCNEEHCLHCDYHGKEICDSCEEGYYLIDGKCSEASVSEQNCLVKKENNQCSICKQGYYLAQGQCSTCTTDCQLCINENTCIKCNDGLILSGGTCQQKPQDCTIQNCTRCETQDEGTMCMECEAGYELNTLENRCEIKAQTSMCEKYDCFLCEDPGCNLKCQDKQFFNIETQKCESCSEPNCQICYSVGCLQCEEDYAMYLGQCLPINKNPLEIKNCISYDLFGNCLLCDTNCKLDSNSCSCSHTGLVIIIVVVIITVIIGALGVVIFLKKKKNAQMRLRQIEEEKRKEAEEAKAIEETKIKKEKLDEIEQKDNLIEKCGKCKEGRGFIELGCGCILCLEDFEKIQPEYNCCPICRKEITSKKEISSKCEICFQVTSEVFGFNCGCAFRVCGNCFNKIVEGKKCPGCRKDIINRPAPEMEVKVVELADKPPVQ